MLSKAFLENYRALRKKMGTDDEKRCKCGNVSEAHCRAFPDNVWFGCLKHKNLSESKEEDNVR